MILLLGVFLVKKEEDVVYGDRDKGAWIFNWVIGAIALPFFWALGGGWDLLDGKPFAMTLSALLAPITVLGICASVILRRKGKSIQGMLVQFAGPALFMYLLFTNIFFLFPIAVIVLALETVFSKVRNFVMLKTCFFQGFAKQKILFGSFFVVGK